MAQMAILIAVVLIMAFTPLGYLKTVGLEISLITIPVAIGAMVIGPGAGAVLGAVFGLTSFYQCFGMSQFGAMLLSINPLYTFFVCVPTRILMGYLAGVLFKVFIKADNSNTICYFVGGFMTAFLNTLFFMGTLILFFWNTEYIQSLNAAGANALMFVVAFVGINGVVEWIATTIVGGIVSKAVAKIAKNV
ncbi:MAG: ECF transporter S component [Lachnospiraceae bacterium]|nr:ECF transporter S component [Lachnospiraceae bacterium]